MAKKIVGPVKTQVLYSGLVIFCGAAIVSFPAATYVQARSNILTGGVSTTYDLQNRDGDSIALSDSSNDDYSTLSVAPFLQLVSSSKRETFELRAALAPKYDLEESEIDMDYELSTSFERSMSRAWHFNIADSFIQSDHQSSETSFLVAEDSETVAEPVETTEPQLSSDLGRRRYWRNSFVLGSDYSYRPESLVQAGFDWIVLRNDDSDQINDYDRYSVTLRNEHRYTANWKTSAEVRTVYGDFDETEAEELSGDLWEYYFDAGLENNSIKLNPLSLTYSYIANRYEEAEQSDSDIHQMRFNWGREFSPHFYTNVGAGPSYTKTEGQDGSWGGNGIIEANYQVRRGSYYVALEKDYGLDNFSGTDQRGVVDTWNAVFSFNRRLTRYLSMDGNIGYLHEVRTTPVVTDDATAGVTTEEITEEQYSAGLGVSYIFMQHYTARASYNFITQESDQDDNDYDDHRIVLSLSWQQDLMRW